MDPALIEEIRSVLTGPRGPREIHRAMRLVPDDVVQQITASGSPEECRAKVAEYVDAGATGLIPTRSVTTSDDDRHLRC